MRQDYRAGEKMFVDYAGQTVPLVDRATGEIHQAQIFISVLGASHYTYAEATWSQSLPDWINSHVRALSFFQGAPELVIPDNLKSGVTKASRYEPDLNPPTRNSSPIMALLSSLPAYENLGTRRSLYESLDRPALKPLPINPYVYAEWKKARVHIDYHIEILCSIHENSLRS